jgi:diaminopimelate decarboxylase
MARQFGTPLYVYCQETIERSLRAVREAMAGAGSVHYAAKAYLAPWLVAIVQDSDIGLDVCSGPELELARACGFPPHRLRLHGNNKSAAALRLALEQRIAAVVIDSMDELAEIGTIAETVGASAPVLLRLNPGITAHTHHYLQTGAPASKFGLSIATGEAERAVIAALKRPQTLTLLGYHAHIGTQILDLDPFRALMQVLDRFSLEMHDRHGFWPPHLSPGGGAGICYTTEQPLDLVAWINTLKALVPRIDLQTPHLSIEPGRAIVGPAGVAIYSVGTVKNVAGERIFVSVDGGMADNIRPVLYGAQYAAVPVTASPAQPEHSVTVAGSYCESGDILIQEAHLPPLRRGDLLAVPAAGAYCLAMASNYNGALRPAVVVVQDGRPRLVQRRQTVQDLRALDVP